MHCIIASSLDLYLYTAHDCHVISGCWYVTAARDVMTKTHCDRWAVRFVNGQHHMQGTKIQPAMYVLRT